MAETGIRIETADWFVNTVCRDMVAGREQRVWVLGAGASKESGVPLAAEFAERWARELFGPETLTDDDDFKNRLAERGWSRNQLASHYFDIFDVRFASADAGARDLLNHITGKFPSFGYYVLAHLLEKSVCNVAVTVNFDNLIADALANIGDGYHQDLNHEDIAHHGNDAAGRPSIWKLHRSLTMAPLNSAADMALLHPNWLPPLNHLFAHRSPIFAGYGGNDRTLMGYLLERTVQFPGLPIWLTYSPTGRLADRDLRSALNPQCLEFLQRTGGCVVPISSFDVLMHLTADRLLPEFDPIKIVTQRNAIRGAQLTDQVARMGGRIRHSQVGDPVAAAVRESPALTPLDLFIEGLAQTDPRQAIRRYDRAIAMAPEFAAAFNSRGNAKVRADLADAALSDFHRATELEPANPVFRSNAANAMEKRGDLEVAEGYYKDAIRLDPSYTWAHYNLGTLYLRLNRLPEARECFNASLRAEPGNYRALSNLGRVELLQGDPEAAIRFLKTALAYNQDDAKIYRNLAEAYTELDRIQEAVLSLSHVVDIDPLDSDAWDWRGQAYLKIGEVQRAHADFERACELNPARADYLCHAGIAESLMGNTPRALTLFDSALELAPKDGEALLNRAVVLQKTGHVPEAVRDLTSLLAHNPENADAYRRRADCLRETGDYAGALTDYTRAIEIAPDCAKAFSGRSEVCLRLGKLHAAIADGDKAIAISTENPVAFLNRGAALARLRDPARALEDFDRALALDPNYREALHNRGVALGELGRYEEAFADLARAIELDPLETLQFFSRALVYALAGNTSQALDDLETAANGDSQLLQRAKRMADFAAIVSTPRFEELLARYQTPPE